MAVQNVNIVLGEQDSEAIYLLRDLNGDGDIKDAGERITYFDDRNQSGLTRPITSVLDMFQTSKGLVYAGDNATDSVYQLRDRNGDGDANDTGEAKVWFSGTGNAEGFMLPTPNGLAEDAKGNVYVVNAGTASLPNDVIYKTTDLNKDGDANDAGEAKVWLDLKTINPSSSAFEINFSGSVAYVSDTTGADPDTIYRIVDKDKSGDIQSDEVNVFISDANPYGANPDFAFDVIGNKVYSFEFSAGGANRLFEYVDRNGSGTIDDAGEVREVWSAGLLPAGYTASAGPGMEASSDGTIYLTLNGAQASQDNLVRLIDVNGDGDFKDDGETVVLASRLDGDDWLSRPRPVETYNSLGKTTNLVEDQGSRGDDNYDGVRVAERWHGLEGNDVAHGNNGSDQLYGDAGNDTLYGDGANDFLDGGANDDILFGGQGNDTLYGQDGNDQLTGDAGNDVMFGGAGDDVLSLGRYAGNDVVDGGDGTDVLNFSVRSNIFKSAIFQGELTELKSFAESGEAYTYKLASLNLTVTDIEQVNVSIG